MKLAYLNLLENVVEEFGEKMTLDEDFFAKLRLAKVITKTECEIILDKKTTSLRLLHLFDEILPLKEDTAMKKLRDVFRAAGKEVVANFLAEKIIAIEENPESFLAASGSSTARRTLRQTSWESIFFNIFFFFISKFMDLFGSSPLARGVKSLKDHMRKYFHGNQFATLKIMVTDDIFRIDDLWVNLEMKTPKGTDWSPVKDYESSLTKSLLENIPVIVRGDPGVGKSTLVQKICYDWAVRSNKIISKGFGKFDLLLPCRLREADPAETIPKLVLQQLKKLLAGMGSVIDNLSADLDRLFERYKVLIVLDGWDEDLGNCEELRDLLDSNAERRYSLLITTRPREMKRSDSRFRLYQIVGFNDNDKRRFIDNFCRMLGKEDSEAERLKQELQDKPHLKEMARIPLLLASICTVEDASAAKSTTELYTCIVNHMVITHREKDLGADFPDDWEKDRRIIDLGRLALEGILQKDQEHQLVFKEGNLKDRISPEILKMGLLCRENQHKLQQASYNVSFPHKTFQEYFAALFIRSRFGKQESLSESLKTETIEKEHWGRLLEQTTGFLVGLSQRGESKMLTDCLNRNRLLSSFVSDEGKRLWFHDRNPILRECKDRITASTICRIAAETYAEECKDLYIELRVEDFQFLSESIGSMRFDQIFLASVGRIPCFSFLPASGDLTATPDSSANPTGRSNDRPPLSCDRLTIDAQDQEEALKAMGCFKSFSTLSFLLRDSFNLTEIISSCPSFVEYIAFNFIYMNGIPSPVPDSFRSDLPAAHPLIKEMGFDNLEENGLEPCLNIAAAFPDLTGLRFSFVSFPSPETIRETLIPGLQQFESLRDLVVGTKSGDNAELKKEVEAGLREKEMDGVSLRINTITTFEKKYVDGQWRLHVTKSQ